MLNYGVRSPIGSECFVMSGSLACRSCILRSAAGETSARNDDRDCEHDNAAPAAAGWSPALSVFSPDRICAGWGDAARRACRPAPEQPRVRNDRAQGARADGHGEPYDSCGSMEHGCERADGCKCACAHGPRSARDAHPWSIRRATIMPLGQTWTARTSSRCTKIWTAGLSPARLLFIGFVQLIFLSFVAQAMVVRALDNSPFETRFSLSFWTMYPSWTL